MHPRTIHSPDSGRPQPRRAQLRVAGLLAALAALTGALADTPSVAHAAGVPSTEWSVSPSDADGPDGRVSLRHVGDPGQTIEDAIAVTNLGSASAAFGVLAGDGILGGDGAFDIAAESPERAGSWVGIDGLDDGRLVLDAGETRVLPVSIAIPADATPGDHPAGIVVALSQNEDSVTVTNRIGVRLHLQVAGDIVPKLTPGEAEATFTPSALPFAPGAIRIEVPVTNDGNVRLGAGATATVAGPFGIGSTSTSSSVDELLPGDRGTVVLEAAAWPAFLVSGEVSVTGLAVGEDQVQTPATLTVPYSEAAMPWAALVVLALLAAVTAALIVVRRRRRRPRAPREDSNEKTAQVETPGTPREREPVA